MLLSNFGRYFGVIGHVNVFEVCIADHTFFVHRILEPIDEAGPIGLAHKNDREVLYLARLNQGEGFEHFVHGAHAPGKDHERL